MSVELIERHKVLTERQLCELERDVNGYYRLLLDKKVETIIPYDLIHTWLNPLGRKIVPDIIKDEDGDTYGYAIIELHDRHVQRITEREEGNTRYIDKEWVYNTYYRHEIRMLSRIFCWNGIEHETAYINGFIRDYLKIALFTCDDYSDLQQDELHIITTKYDEDGYPPEYRWKSALRGKHVVNNYPF